jgi:hypothetical protein
MSAHRRRASTRALTTGTPVVPAVAVGAIGRGLVEASAGEPSAAPKTAVTVTASSAPVERTVTPGPLVLARRTLAPADMSGGERVLDAEANQKQPRHWIQWGGVVDRSVTDCGTGRLTVETGFLTPVERRSSG